MTQIERIRNLGIVAHINAGKTTLSERILYATGRQRFLGDVDAGTATMDFLAEERQRGISINAAVTSVLWKGYRLNLIDTPGHVDFTAEVERCLRVLDGVIVVLDGVKGVESQTETVWRRADARGTPRLVFVNKLDREAASFEASAASLRARLGCRPVPVVRPLRRDGALVGLVDVVGGRVVPFAAGVELDPAQLAALRAEVIEVCADGDEEVMAAFVEERPIEATRLHAALRRATLAKRIVPVLAGAALPSRGVDLLLDAACRYLPSPLDVGPVRSCDGQAGDESDRRDPSVDAPVCALVFKSRQDRAGGVHFARLYSGTLRPGDELESSGGGGAFRVGEVLAIHAEHEEPLAQAGPGDVVALACPAPLRTGDTLFAPGWPMRLEPMQFPRPVLTAVIEPRSSADAAAVEFAARALAVDDPTLTVERDADSGNLLVSGMGELHLEVFQSQLTRAVGDRARFGRPTVALLETVARLARATAECRAADGTARAIATVEIGPATGPARIECWVEDSPEAAALREDLEARLRSGLSAPYPATNLVLRLLAIDCDARAEQAVVLCLESLTVACRKATASAQPRLLEPLMRFELRCPPETLSGVLADLRSRGADLEAVEAGDGGLVRGTVRLDQILGYATRLRSLTRGLGTMTAGPCGFVERREPPARP